MACLLVQYAAWSCRANLEAVLDTLTILPPLPRAIILLAHSWARMKGALTFTCLKNKGREKTTDK